MAKVEKAEFKSWFYFFRVNGGTAFGLQDLMVIPTIERLGTQEQQDKWLPLCRSLKVIGNYGQTELGHGIFSLTLVLRVVM